jgi:hypothetical protein
MGTDYVLCTSCGEHYADCSASAYCDNCSNEFCHYCAESRKWVAKHIYSECNGNCDAFFPEVSEAAAKENKYRERSDAICVCLDVAKRARASVAKDEIRLCLECVLPETGFAVSDKRLLQFLLSKDRPDFASVDDAREVLVNAKKDEAKRIAMKYVHDARRHRRSKAIETRTVDSDGEKLDSESESETEESAPKKARVEE